MAPLATSGVKRPARLDMAPQGVEYDAFDFVDGVRCVVAVKVFSASGNQGRFDFTDAAVGFQIATKNVTVATCPVGIIKSNA